MAVVPSAWVMMVVMLVEDARQCRRCGNRWFAPRAGAGSAPAQTDRWARCPNCGSILVDTVPDRGFVPTGAGSPEQVARAQAMERERVERAEVEAQFRRDAYRAQLEAAERYRREHPVRVGLTGFLRVHWRITLAVVFTLATLGAITSTEDPIGERIIGGLVCLVAAIVCWRLHLRHRRGSASGAQEGPRSEPEVRHPGEGAPLDMALDDAWARRLVGCRDRAATFAGIAAQTPSQVVGDWMRTMSEQIDDQLRQADELATLGRSVEPGFTGAGEPSNTAAREVWARLGEFEASMDEMVTGAARVRLEALQPAASLESVRVQLDMLQNQVPNLDS